MSQIYVNGDFDYEQQFDRWRSRPGSHVELILGNGVFSGRAATPRSTICPTTRRTLAILGTEDFKTMIWRSNSQFWGVMYVPEANIDYSANADLFGSIVCNNISMSSNAGIHYDESLASWDKYGTPSAKFQVQCAGRSDDRGLGEKASSGGNFTPACFVCRGGDADEITKRLSSRLGF